MLRREKSAPIWLFSFVDLAFLLLIAFTQISPTDPSPLPGVAQLEIPQIESPADPIAGNPTARLWQLRVHSAEATKPRDLEANSVPPASRSPFQLISPEFAANPEGAGARRIDSVGLAEALSDLLAESESKPILTPHPDARAEDLLVAVGLLSEVWHGGRAVAVLPRPQVAAGPRSSSDASDR